MSVKKSSGMTIVVKTVTKLTLGFIALYGVYIALSGHFSPGGGFAGGVIIALSFVHIMLAFGKDVALKRVHSFSLRYVLGLAAFIFLAVVMTNREGLISSTDIFGPNAVSRILNNEITIPLCEMAIVGAGLYAIFIALVLLSKSDKDSE